jgi:hypothetical protein
MGPWALACGIFALLTIYTAWGAFPLGIRIVATLVVIGVALWYVFRPDGYFPCLSKAGDDTTAQEQCKDQFHDDVPSFVLLSGR